MTASSSTIRFLLVAALPLVLVAWGGAPPAHAEDPAEDARVREAENLVERITAFIKEKKKDDIERALPRLVKIHNELKTGTARAALQKAAGDVMSEKKLGAVRMLAADSLGKVNDPKGGWKQLKRFMPPVKEEAAGPFPLRVIQAVGALAPDAAITPLMQLMDKAKDLNVSRFAIQALGKFGWSKRRTQVLGALASFLVKLRPGGADPRKGRRGGEAARRRFDFLQRTLVAAMNEITGQKIDTVDKWLETYKANKKKLAKLFTFER